MSEVAIIDRPSLEPEKPVQAIIEDVRFPPYPEPTDDDFDDDNMSEEEKSFYKTKFPDLNLIVHQKLHCTACDRHLGSSTRNETRMRAHPMLRTLVCHTCHSFYNSGEFDKGDDGSELYCRWCGQGGQVYCCSDCPHVFCAKCIRRNLGNSKIKEIENTDDWKCLKCNPRCLWDLRAICWALLRYCDLRNKMIYTTEDPLLKEKYQKVCALDLTECCKNKGKRKEKTDSAKKKEKEKEKEKEAENVAKQIISKMPATIQVKKFASINLDESPKIEKKAQKRPASPKNKTTFIKQPIAIAPCAIGTPPVLKKVRFPSTTMLNPLLNPVRFANEKKFTNTYARGPRPRQMLPIAIANNPFNGFNSSAIYNNSVNSMHNYMGDNINLSLETLTQGLDMAAVAAFNNNAAPAFHNNAAPSFNNNTTPSFNNNAAPDNDVVCTPDFPLEPLCEVTEDNDDDVECITPGPPPAAPKISNPPPLVPRTLPDMSTENIIQMTDNDVTVNALTGGLKFRVDPQTLSSNKMYRLPDGRIFAINANPNMPGGYSATIVSVSDATGKVAPKGETYAAKLSAVGQTPPSGSKKPRILNHSGKLKRKYKIKLPKAKDVKKTNMSPRQCDLKVPVEWYRYNLIDAVDALEYSLSRLHKLKKEATTNHLRSRTVDEIKYLHRSLEQLLTTSSKRFLEIRENLNKELKEFIMKKTNDTHDDSDEDDDVEILPDAGNDDPIFIDENSVDSVNCDETQEVDLTGAAGSEHNDSGENKNESNLNNEQVTESGSDANNVTVISNDSLAEPESILSDLPNVVDNKDAKEKLDDNVENKQDDNENDTTENEDVEKVENAENENKEKVETVEEEKGEKTDTAENKKNEKVESAENGENETEKEEHSESSTQLTSDEKDGEINGEGDKLDKVEESNKVIGEEVDCNDHNMELDSNDQSAPREKPEQASVDRTQDIDMTEDLIESLLKDDNVDDTINKESDINSMEVPDES